MPGRLARFVVIHVAWSTINGIMEPVAQRIPLFAVRQNSCDRIVHKNEMYQKTVFSCPN